MKISAILPSANALTLATRRRRGIFANLSLSMMCCWLASPASLSRLLSVSKKNAMGRAHGFACETQGTLFFDVVRIIAARQPAIFVLENVKNLKSHDQGRTFRIIMQTLDELGYEVADAGHTGPDDPKVIDGRHFLPQHRERIVLVGFRRDLQLHAGFTLRDIAAQYPAVRPTFGELLEPTVDAKFILTLGAVEISLSLCPQASGAG